MNQVWLAFLTGLTTGGISCMAVQGGLLATSLSQKTEIELTKKDKMMHVAIFLTSKLIAYTILGFLLGFAGSALIISPVVQGWLQIFVGFFMLATAGRLLNFHPVFRYFVIQPPKFVYKLMKNQSKKASLFTPALLGVMTLLIPCGITQAMLVLAVGTGSPIYGALIMFAFTLGTSPIFFALGMAAVEILKRRAFTVAASIVVIILGFLSINTGQVLRGSSHTLQNYQAALSQVFSGPKTVQGAEAPIAEDGKQELIINVKSNGYQSSVKTLKANVPVRMKLVTNKTFGCSRAFAIPSMNISKILPETGEEIIEFTPTKTGNLVATCSMGMYLINFQVI